MAPTRGNLHRNAADPADEHRRGGGLIVAIAQLPRAVVAPTAHIAILQRTARIPPDRNGCYPTAESRDVHDIGSVIGRAISQLPEFIVAPTLDSAAGGECTTMPPPRHH